VNGTDISGLTLATLNHIPGNVLKGNWRVIFMVDDRATPEQERAIVDLFSGKLGGPVANLAGLYGEVVRVEKAPITFEVTEGKGHLKIGKDIEAVMTPYQGATGRVTTLHDTAFSTIPGSPAYVSKAESYRAKNSTLGFNIDLKGHNAIQGKFHFKS
jgi:hypothetical protein